MAYDRPDEQIQLNLGVDNDASARLLADAMPGFNRVTKTNDAQAEQMERVMKDVERGGLKPSDVKAPAGQREILIQWGDTSIDDLLKDLKLEPTPEEREKVRKEAKENLETSDLYKLLSKADQQTMTKMQEAILKGDTKALAELVKQYKGDPEKLEAIGHVIEKNLKDMGANVQVDITDTGKLLVYDKLGRHAIEVSADGKVAVRPVQVNLDGSVEVLEGRQVLRPKADQVAKGIADGAVHDAVRPKTIPPWGVSPGSPGGFPPGGLAPGEPRIELYQDASRKI